MILLNKGASNTIALSLKEKETLSSPYYLWRFSFLGGTYTSAVIAATDRTTYNQWYTFIIIEGTTIILSMAGDWKYEIYEQTSSTNTDVTQATGLLEKGIARVIDSSNVINYLQYNDATDVIQYGAGD
mgnify:CR=1 FL=1